jgi:hypothetical protein
MRAVVIVASNWGIGLTPAGITPPPMALDKSALKPGGDAETCLRPAPRDFAHESFLSVRLCLETFAPNRIYEKINQVVRAS